MALSATKTIISNGNAENAPRSILMPWTRYGASPVDDLEVQDNSGTGSVNSKYKAFLQVKVI